MNAKRVIVCDKVKLAKAKVTDDGFIKGEAVVTRPGIFKYITADGKVSRRFRPPEEVSKQSHLDSMKMMPITDGHPKERWVDVTNARQASIGQTGENIKVVDQYPIAPISIIDQAAINDIKAGKITELSLGYTTELDHTPGTYQGEPYDCIQRNMQCNHLALVKHGRANAANSGEFAQVNLCDSLDSSIFTDSNDAVLDSQVEDISISFGNQQKEGDNNMLKITLDGIQYDAAPEVVNALNKGKTTIDEKQKQLDDAGVAYKKLQADHDALQAKHDTLDGELKKSKAANDSIDIKGLAKARLKIVDEARAILSDEESKKIEDMADADIKKAVIKAMSPNVNLDEKNDVYIDARYEACIDLQPDPDAIASQRLMAKTPGKKAVTANDAREKMIAKMFNGGKAAKEGGE